MSSIPWSQRSDCHTAIIANINIMSTFLEKNKTLLILISSIFLFCLIQFQRLKYISVYRRSNAIFWLLISLIYKYK